MNRREIFENELSKLSIVLNQNLEGNKEIFYTIKWCRDEYIKVPFLYPGDEYVVSCIKYQVCKGFSFKESLFLAKKTILDDIELKIFHQMRGR